jgi:hypothetical protein
MEEIDFVIEAGKNFSYSFLLGERREEDWKIT